MAVKDKMDGNKETSRKEEIKGELKKHDVVKEERELSLFDLFREAEKRKEEINKPDEKGRTPLFYAVMRNDLEEVKRLIKQGVDLFVKDCNGLSALNYATDPNIKMLLVKEMKKWLLEG